MVKVANINCRAYESSGHCNKLPLKKGFFFNSKPICVLVKHTKRSIECDIREPYEEPRLPPSGQGVPPKVSKT